MVILITGQTILPNFRRIIILLIIINDNNKVQYPKKQHICSKFAVQNTKKQSRILTSLRGFVCTLIDSVADVAWPNT